MTPDRAHELLSSPSFWPITSRITEAERAWLWESPQGRTADRTIQDELRDLIASAALAQAAWTPGAVRDSAAALPVSATRGTPPMPPT